jgi:mannose-6-phosphate isomerase-like protein (cupin superfamily)
MLGMRSYLIQCRAVGEETGETLTVLEFTVPPNEGPPLHIHHNEDETYYVLEGTFVIQVGTKVYELTPGGCVYGPRGVTHAFVNAGSKPGKLLIIATPAGMEHYHEEAGKMADARMSAPQAIALDAQLAVALAEKYRFEVVGPPLCLDAVG